MKKLFKTLAAVGSETSPKVESSASVSEAIFKVLTEEQEDPYKSKRFSPGGYVCSRFKAHERLHDFKPRMDPMAGDTLYLLKAGTAYHDMYQSGALADTKQLWGDWKCPSCGSVHKNSVQPDKVCSGSRNGVDCSEVLNDEKIKWLYVEGYMRTNPLDNKLYEISGYRDGIWLQDGGWYVLEIKTTNKGTFDATYQVKHPEEEGQFVVKPTQSRLPLKTHCNQANVYAKMTLDEVKAGEIPLKEEDFKGCIILYIDRDTGLTKEFSVDYSSYAYQELLTLAKHTRKAVEAEDIMVAPAKCTNRTNTLAKQCPLRDTCFPPKKRKTVKKK